MAIHQWNDLKQARIPKGRLAEIEDQIKQEVLEMNLAAVRELVGKTQVDVAEAVGTTQPEVSRSEHRSDHLVSTLQQYIQALGGELEIIARFGDKTVRLRGV
jgi:hypothetical protein